MRDWDGWADVWTGWVEDAATSVFDGSGIRVARRRHKPAHFKQRTPEDIRREQLEDERYLAELEARRQADTEKPRTDAAAAEEPVAEPPILADVAARAASAVQAKLEEAAQAARADRLADDKRRRTLALLLALD